MFGVNFTYILSILFLSCFGILFFTVDFYLPQIRVWKSHKLHKLSEIYLDESIDNVGGLIDQGINRAGIAHLLNPSDSEILLTYIKLNYRTNPSKALLRWSRAADEIQSPQQHIELLQKSVETLKNESLSTDDRTIAAQISYKQIRHLMQDSEWASLPDNILIFCELLAETGKAVEARMHLNKLLENYPHYPEAVFLLTRISVHLKDDSQLLKIGRLLATLSSQRDQVGLDAIRHMTLLHLLNPLSPKSLKKCIQLLTANPLAKPIDFMRIYALQYATSNNLDTKNSIIVECATLFDLGTRSNLITFSSWLARLGNFAQILHYVPPSLARVDEDLFKLRMNALAQDGDLESILNELSNAPLIPTLWRMVVEARTYSMQNKLQESFDVLDRLLPLLDDDPREIRAVCAYLEASNDINALCHILEKLADQSIHSKYALLKLLEHRSADASISKLQNWVERLSKINQNNKSTLLTSLYLQILNPQLTVPSSNFNELLSRLKSLNNFNPSSQISITLALAYLRNGQPDKSLVALGRIDDWRQWIKSREAWSFIASQVYRLNNDAEKALVISENIDFSKISRAEKESLQALFPNKFK